jgi:hypothetical protein
MTEEQERMLKDVHTAIVGDEKYGHLGLVSRTRKTEEKVKNIEKKGLLIGAAGAGAFLGMKGLLMKLFGWL